MNKEKSNMEEIRIYHSVKRMLFLIIIGLAFVAISISMYNNPKANHVIAWLGILFFGLGSLFMIVSMLKERLTQKPYLTITDEGLTINTMKQCVVNFADVESFDVRQVKNEKFVAIHYKPNVERKKMKDASTVGRAVRELNVKLINAQENIAVTGTSIKAEELCDLLNERQKAAQKASDT